MTEGGLCVRVGEAGDFPRWFTLFSEVAAERKWIGTEPPIDRDASERRFVTSSEAGVAFVAEAGSELVGGLGLTADRGVAQLGMFIASEWRGRGVGSALMEAAVGWARDAGAHKIAVHKMVLTVWPHNAGAIALYRKFGFREEGRLRRHYRRHNGQLWDGLSMGLVLDEESPGSPYGG